MLTKGTRKAFITGLAALLPTALTIIIVVKVYQLVANTIGSAFTLVIRGTLDLLTPWSLDYIPDWLLSAGGVLLAVVFVFFLGLVLASIIGRRAWGFVESRFMRVPVLRTVYTAFRQITEFLFGERKLNFRQVVLFEYPRRGIYTLGFITGQAFELSLARDGQEHGVGLCAELSDAVYRLLRAGGARGPHRP